MQFALLQTIEGNANAFLIILEIQMIEMDVNLLLETNVHQMLNATKQKLA